MDASVLASYGMAAVGVVLVAIGLRRLFAMRIAYPLANAMLLKLAAANNPDRAEKLCKAASGTSMDAIAAAIRAATATGSHDLVTIAAASRSAFDASGAALA